MAAESGLPIRLLEVGASAELNLRLENYWFEAGGAGFGEPDSPVRFVDVWDGGTPPLAPFTIVDRLPAAICRRSTPPPRTAA